MVNSKEIIMILDYLKVKDSSLSQGFLESLGQQKWNDENNDNDEETNTIIVIEKKTYFSSIAPSTIEKRIKKFLY